MIYILFTFFLDLFLSFFISVSYQNISFFFPSVIVVSIPVFYNLIKNKKTFFFIVLILGVIYDSLFSDIFLINTYYYLLLGFFIYIFYENHRVNLINILLISIVGLFFYDIFIFFILILTDYSYFSFLDLVYKLKRTFLLNFLYLGISIFLFKSRIFGLKRSKKR